MAAEKRWTGPTLIRPLVHLNEVLDAQARQRLTPENRICLSMPVQPDRPSERLNSCDSSTLQKILAIVESRPNACLGELSLLFTDATGDPSASQERAFAATSRIWIELINYGILNLVASD